MPTMSRIAGLEEYLAGAQASAAQAPSFQQVREQRALTDDLEAQRLLALEDRRAFAREYVQDQPVRGALSMLLLAPAEQAYKGLNHLAGRQVGRSGFFSPLANIGAAYQGTLEGLATHRRFK